MQVSFEVMMGFGDQAAREFEGTLDGKNLKGQMTARNSAAR